MGAVESTEQRPRTGEFVNDPWWNPPSKPITPQGADTEKKQLQAKLEEVETELSSARAQVKRLSTERQELEQQLSEAEDERQEMAQQLEDSEHKRRQAARQLQEAEEQRRQLNRRLEEAEGERSRLESRVAALERRLAQTPEVTMGRQGAAAFVAAESRAGAGSVSQDETRARAVMNRPWIQQTAAGQQRTASSATSEGDSNSGGDQRQQHQQKGQQQQQGQGQGQGQGQQRAAATTEERRTLSVSKAAELELFKREVNVKREARQRAMAAVSAELERLRRELRRERHSRRRLEVRLEELGEEPPAEDQPEDEELDLEREEADECDQRCQVTLEEDLHLRLEQAKNELETERELRRTLEDSIEQLHRQLQDKEQLQLEVEELRADVIKKQQLRAKVESNVEKLQAEAVLVEKEKLVNGEEQVAQSVVECLKGQLDSERAARRQLERQMQAMMEAQLKRDRKETMGSTKLEEQLEKEKTARQELERQLAAARQEAKREEDALLRDLGRLRDELDNERDRANRASEEADAVRGRAEAGEEERRRLHDQVAALKDVAAVGRQLLQLREEQVERLEARLQASEAASVVSAGSELQARLPAAVEAAVGELRVEYERQLRAMAALRQLYGERAAAAAADAEQREKRLHKEEQARQEAEARSLRLQEEARRSGEEATALREEVSQIHAALARLLDAASVSPSLALDDLARRLQQNHGLLADIAAEGLDAAELSRTLMDLAAQAEAAGGVAHQNDGVQTETDAKTDDKADAIANADGAPSAPAMDRAEIMTNLPKVCKVLMELLSQQQTAGESGDAAAEDSSSDVKSHCYKSVDTPYGPRLVISVSQTFLRLKELILEKKSLQRELSRLQQLNGHLETELGRQQQRLSLVSSELRKTWGVVGRMRAQHRQLHTHETLLRHELQHKRQLLCQLREELTTCRETWQRARQKSSESELEWRALRTEFAERRRQRDAGSTESGCYSDSGDDAKETPSGGSCSPVVEETTGLEVDTDAEDPGSCPPPADDDDPASCPTVSMVKKLKEQLASFSRSLESVARDDEESLQSIFSLPAITIPEAVYRHLGWAEEACADSPQDSGECIPQEVEETNQLPKSACLQGTTQDELQEGVTPLTKHGEGEQKEEGRNEPPASTLSEAVPKTETLTVNVEQNGDSSITDGAGGQPQTTETEEDRRKRFQENAYRRLAAYLEVPPGILEDDFFLPTSTRSESPAEPQLPVVAPLDQQALEARAERLRRLEEQCQQLVRRVTRTAHRGDRLYSRLEELHEQYGSSSSPDEASPAAPASPISVRRASRAHQLTAPPPPPPLPSALQRIPAPPHLPDTLPTHRLPTTDTTTGQQPPPPLLLPPVDSPPPGNDNPNSGNGPAEG